MELTTDNSIFDYTKNQDLIKEKISKYITYNVYFDNYPILKSIEELFDICETSIKIYKSYNNYLYLANKNSNFHKINITFYTNTDLIIYIENLVPCNESNLRINNLQHQMDSRSIIKFYGTDKLNYTFYSNKLGNLYNIYNNKKVILDTEDIYNVLKNAKKYILPSIYLDYLQYADDNIFNNIHKKSLICDNVMKHSIALHDENKILLEKNKLLIEENKSLKKIIKDITIIKSNKK